MSDLISRQDAIKTFYKYPNGCWTTLDVMNEISKLPSAEQKRGEWIVQDGAVRCSECGEPNMKWNFCPNCGADMRGE